MIGRLNHVAIAVPDLAAATATYGNALGAKVSAPMPQPAHGVTVVFVELPNTKIELLHPPLDNSPTKGFLERNPSGRTHHGRGSWATASQRSVPTTSRCCSSIPRISTAP